MKEMRFRKKRKFPKGTSGGEFSNKCCLSFDFHPRRFFCFHETQQSVFVKSSMNLNYKILHVNRWVKITKHHITDGISNFPTTGLDRPLGFQEVEAPEFLDNRHYEGGKVVSPTHRPSLPPGMIPGTHFCYRLTGRISLKNSSDSIGNRTRNLPVFSAVPQPNAPPHNL
jgi:hypothetical protein